MNRTIVAKAEMLIRRPVAEVFEAFVNPEITTKFWFTKSSGRLEVGKQVTWEWEMYGASTDVTVKELEKKLNEIGGAGTQGELKSDNSLYPSIRKLPLLGVTYADLYRQTKIEETVYELLTQQYEVAKVQ